MNEIASVLKTVNTTIRTVKIIEAAKKVTIVTSAALCCVFAYRFLKK